MDVEQPKSFWKSLVVISYLESGDKWDRELILDLVNED